MIGGKPNLFHMRPRDVRAACEAFLLAVEWSNLGDLSPEAVKRLRLKVQGDLDRLSNERHGTADDAPFTNADAVWVLSRVAKHVTERTGP